MSKAWTLGLPALTIFLVTIPALAGTPGSFRGVLFDGANTKPGWMYVQSRNEMLRLVKLSGATVSYAEEVPVSERLSSPRESLVSGAEVRVLAEQDSQGHWRALQIEILHLAPARRARQ